MAVLIAFILMIVIYGLYVLFIGAAIASPFLLIYSAFQASAEKIGKFATWCIIVTSAVCLTFLIATLNRISMKEVSLSSNFLVCFPNGLADPRTPLYGRSLNEANKDCDEATSGSMLGDARTVIIRYTIGNSKDNSCLNGGKVKIRMWASPSGQSPKREIKNVKKVGFEYRTICHGKSDSFTDSFIVDGIASSDVLSGEATIDGLNWEWFPSSN
jgi:hypothetical protein